MINDPGNALRKIRRISGVKLDDAAKLTGVGKSYLCMLETGKRKPTPNLITALSETYDIDGDILYNLLFGTLKESQRVALVDWILSRFFGEEES